MKTFLKIVSVLGTLLWALAFFFGFNYYLGGSLMVSIPCAIFLALILGGSIYLAIVKSKEKDKVAQNTERLALGVYVLFSVLSCVFVGHFVDVTANKQEAIQKEALAQIDELGVTFNHASDGVAAKASSYEDWVANMAATYKISLEGSGFDEGTIETKMSEFRDMLLDEDFLTLQNRVNRELDNYYDPVFNWRWFSISDVLSNLQTNKPDWEASVRVQSQVLGTHFGRPDVYRAVSEHNDFELYNGLTTLDLGGCFGWMSILLIVVLQFMMIFVYFAVRPDRASGARRYRGAGVGTFNGNFDYSEPAPKNGPNDNQLG